MSSLASQYFRDITPDDIDTTREHNSYAIAQFQGQLLLAIIDNDYHQARSFYRILAYNHDPRTWRVIHREVVEGPPGPDLTNHDAVTKTGVTSLSPHDETHCAIRVIETTNPTASQLYVHFTSPFGSHLLSSRRGEAFELIPDPSFGVKQLLTLAQPQSFKHYLYALQAVNADCIPSNSDSIFVGNSEDLEQWQTVKASDLLDLDSPVLSQLAIFDTSLYLAIADQQYGFQLWKASLNPPPLGDSQQVLTNGAYRYLLNRDILAMIPFRNKLLIASGVPKTQDISVPSFYSSGFELICVYPNDEWALILGTPRFTPDGIRVPLTGFGPGFDDYADSVFECLVTHGHLVYVGVQNKQGFQLWSSEDAQTWTVTVLAELSSYYQIKVGAALSTPQGLILALETVEVYGDPVKLKLYLF